MYHPLIQRWIGLVSCCALALLAHALPSLPGLGTLTLAVLLGLACSQLFTIPDSWRAGLAIAQGPLLRLAVALYGLQLALPQLWQLGAPALLLDALVVSSVLVLGLWLGQRLGLSRDTALLVACGSAICGAAAILAADRVLRPQHSSAVAVALGTVLLFGTLALLIYPPWLLWLELPSRSAGIYLGATVHEVAQVVAAGNALGPQIAEIAVVTKLTRVLFLLPVLLLLSARQSERGRLPLPLFVLGFIACSAIGSSALLPTALMHGLQQLDQLLLATAMAALGMNTRIAQLRSAGWRPLLLAAGLFVWLLLLGYGYSRWLL